MKRENIIEIIEKYPEIVKVFGAFSSSASAIFAAKKSIESGFGFDISPSGVSEADKAIRQAEDIISSFAAGPAYAAMQLYSMKYEQRFNFVTDPALGTISSSLSGYYQIIGESIVEQERLAQQYRMIGLSSTVNIGGSIINLGVQKALGTEAGKALVARFASRIAGKQLLNGVLGAAAKGAAGRLIGAAFGPVGIAITTVFLLFEVFKVLQNFARNKALVEDAQNKALMELFNPQPLMSLYEKNAFLLGSPNPNNMGGMELLTGTSWEDDLAEGRIPSTINSWSGSVYNSAFYGNFSSRLSGADIRGFGFDNQKVLAAVGNMSRNVQTGANEDVVAQILMTSGLYTGGDTSLVESISQDIIRSSGFTNQDVNQATDRFEEFFAAVVGDGRPQASYLNLVEALSSFSYSYAMGTRANLDSSGAIAEIQQFMGDRGMINGRFDVKATQTAITSIDEFLLMGATYQDLGAAQIMQSMDISREDAIRGVTHDSQTFGNFLDGLMGYLRVSNEDVLNGTRKFDVSLQNFAMMTNISTEQLNAIMVALRRRASGYSVESVRTDYLKNFSDDVDNKLAPYQNFSDNYLSIMEIMSNITYSNNKYLEAIRLNLDTVQLFNDIMFEVASRGFDGAFTSILNSLREMVGIAESFTPVQNALMQQAGIMQGTGVTPPAAGSVDAARNQISVSRQVNRNADAGLNQSILTVDQFLSSLPVEQASFYWELIDAEPNGYNLSLPPDQNFQDFINQARRDYPEIVEAYFPGERVSNQGVNPTDRPQLSNDDKFEAAWNFTKQWEGGFSENPDDPGNWTGGEVGVGELKGTNFGISAASYPNLDIKNLSIDEAKDIYKRDYWDKINGDSLPFPASIAIFDFAVHSGRGRATSFWNNVQNYNLEHFVQFGQEMSSKELIRMLQYRRRSFLRGLSIYDKFGRGFENRLNALDEELSGYLEGYGVGGKVFGFSISAPKKTLNFSSQNNYKNTSMIISVPLQSMNPSRSASRFADLMSKNLS